MNASPHNRDPASFRDPDSTVFHRDGGVYRGLSASGLEDWQLLRDSPLFGRLVDDGRLVATEEADVAIDGFAAVLRHERVPFVSYPYEWPFEMLRDAALLQLDLLLEALAEGLTLKDATPYNVQWSGTKPVFIDVGSFERARTGEPWAGYRQFCMLYLYPLLVQAYRGLDFQPLLRGRVDGIPPAACRAVLGWRDVFRRGVLAHVLLHSRLEARHDADGSAVRQDLSKSGFGDELIRANVTRLRRLVAGLRPRAPRPEWADYGGGDYTAGDAERKAAFVGAAVAQVRPGLVWDLGCNDGRFSRIAAEHAPYVLALDAEHAVVDALYRELRQEGNRAILPLVFDVADPSPALGWRGRERPTLIDRGRPGLVLALALVHHLAITRNVPLQEIVDWLAELGGALVIEFPTPEDARVQGLLARKTAGVEIPYDRDGFERSLERRFDVVRREELAGGARQLYFARPRPVLGSSSS
jgi:SAM-dependent methyltransferase